MAYILSIIMRLHYIVKDWKFISVQGWDAVTGNKLYTFVGHEAPVYSVFPHHKENIQVFSCFICTFSSWQFSLTFLERHPMLVSHASVRVLAALPKYFGALIMHQGKRFLFSLSLLLLFCQITIFAYFAFINNPYG